MNLLEKLKKPMAQNFVSMVLLQGVNYLLPLLSFPFLYRTLGVERVGLVSFGYALIQYFILFADFGFNLSATKYISSNRDNKELINRFLNSAMIGRFLLAIIGFLVLLVLVLFVNKFKDESFFFILYFGMVIGNVMFPMWFFQGIEKMKYITTFNIIAKTISFIPFFIFIRQPQDYILVPCFYSLGYILAGIISLYIIYKKEKMHWFFPAVAEVKSALSESSTYFLSRISLSLFTTSNTLILGLLFGNITVGYYSAAEKLYQAYNQLLTPLSGVLFPHMAKTRDISFFYRIFSWVSISNIFLIIGLLLGSSSLLEIVYGSSINSESLSVFRILIAGCIFTIPSILMGYPFLAAMGYPSYTNWTVVLTSIFHIFGLLILFISGIISIYSVAILVVLSESLLFAFRVKGIYKYNLIVSNRGL